jgi:hypothetical protein
VTYFICQSGSTLIYGLSENPPAGSEVFATYALWAARLVAMGQVPPDPVAL